MKKMKNLRAAVLLLLAALLPALSSCQKESADTGDLLSTVPSSASIVVGCNLRSILEKAGCKVDGPEITPGSEVAAWLEKETGDSHDFLKLLLNGESGIDPTVAVLFMDAYTGYVTAALADTGKFKAFVEKQNGTSFAKEAGDVEVCGNVAVKGAQMWCAITGGSIDAKAVANYANLSESQSFLSKEASAKIANMKDDLSGWSEIRALTRGGMSLGNLSTVNIISGMLFENAACLSFTIDFQKAKMTAKVGVLTEKGEYAKYVLPAVKVDVATVKSVAKTAEAFGAIAINKEFVKKIEKLGSSLGGSAFSQLTNAFQHVDGTIAVAFSDIDDTGNNLSGIVSTDGEAGIDMLSIISGWAPYRKDGDKLVRFSKGQVSGGLSLDKSADYLKGATMGLVIDLNSPSLGAPSHLTTASFAIVPESGGLGAEINVESDEPSKNILVTLLESESKK